MTSSLAVLTPANATLLKPVRRLGPALDVHCSRHQLAFDPSGTVLVVKGWLGSPLRWWAQGAASDSPVCSVDLTLEFRVDVLSVGQLIVGAGPPVGAAATPWRPRLVALSTQDGTLQHEATMPHTVIGLGASKVGTLAVLFEGGEALLWDVRSWRPVRELAAMEADITLKDCAVSPDGRFVAVVGTSHERGGECLWLWDLRTQDKPWRLSLKWPIAWSVAFHPTQPLLVIGGNSDEVTVVDAHARRVVRTLTGVGGYACNLDFSPDGALLVASGDGSGFSVHRFDTGEELFGDGDGDDMQTSDAVISPDGRCIAWGHGDGTVSLWGVAD
ncbi:WD40 repeat domain-containing protein [Corallococcus terminator]|uniref:WD40 repeat domain-containing protein n=1 Tax=Corallococcus terminator TaxID=2316733 RepID=A0A3A8JAT5_9BACT|nr:WD40 repeat domain-containing protein [Corallococcus terminator]RKG92006.1 WD40 repeat domain-containing protein [Corallococcus terminator]